MKGLRLACLYSYKCEPATILGINNDLLEYVKNYSRGLERRNLIISKIRKLAPYSKYERLSDIIGSEEIFNERVVRAYWLGNKRLTSDHSNHNFVTLEKFRHINFDEHLFPWTVEEILDCAISFGRVIEIYNKKARVLNYRLLYSSGKVFWGEKTRDVDTSFVDNLEKGDLISIHLAIAREKISPKQAETLEKITLKALKILQMA